MSFLNSFLKGHDEVFEAATSENLPAGTEDIVAFLDLADKIKSKEIPANKAISALEKRLNHKNPNVQILSLKLLECCVKNCGNHFLVEVASKHFMDNLASMAAANMEIHSEVRKRILEIIKSCGIAFKSKPELSYACETYQRLKRNGIKFPAIEHASSLSNMIDTTTAPDWTDSSLCVRCRTEFTSFVRKHHCRNCGKTYCNECSSKKMPLAKLGITDEVRVCDTCASTLVTDGTKSNAAKHNSSNSFEDQDSAESEQDDDLSRAIAASLKISTEPKRVSSRPSVRYEVPIAVDNSDDADLQRAIAASLRDNQRTSSESSYYQQQKKSNDFEQNQIYSANESNRAMQGSVLNYLVTDSSLDKAISSSEIQSIRNFCTALANANQLVKTQGIQYFDPYPLQAMFSSVSALSPKLVENLADVATRYKSLYDMNSEISSLVQDYDKLMHQRMKYSQSSPFNVQYGGQQNQSTENYNPQYALNPNVKMVDLNSGVDQSYQYHNVPIPVLISNQTKSNAYIQNESAYKLNQQAPTPSQPVERNLHVQNQPYSTTQQPQNFNQQAQKPNQHFNDQNQIGPNLIHQPPIPSNLNLEYRSYNGDYFPQAVNNNLSQQPPKNQHPQSSFYPIQNQQSFSIPQQTLQSNNHIQGPQDLQQQQFNGTQNQAHAPYLLASAPLGSSANSPNLCKLLFDLASTSQMNEYPVPQHNLIVAPMQPAIQEEPLIDI